MSTDAHAPMDDSDCRENIVVKTLTEHKQLLKDLDSQSKFYTPLVRFQTDNMLVPEGDCTYPKDMEFRFSFPLFRSCFAKRIHYAISSTFKKESIIHSNTFKKSILESRMYAYSESISSNNLRAKILPTWVGISPYLPPRTT